MESIWVATRQHVQQTTESLEEAINKNQKITKLTSVFSVADSKFEHLIERNFLYRFDGSDSPDYLRLLSTDFKNLFFSFFNSNDFVCIEGRKGVGKTFNCLLISRILLQEEYKVYYSSVKNAVLSEGIFSELTGLVNKDFVFIIDDCQASTEKTEAILERLSSLKKGIERPKLVFLIRNDGLNIEDIKDILGEKVPILKFKERFIDLKFLAELFFRKINLTEKLDDFLSLLEKSDLSKALFRYKNMEFWNMYFKQVENIREIKIREEDFYKSAYKYFSEKEPYLIQCKDILGTFCTFFKNEVPILRSYVEDIIETYQDQYQSLLDHGVITLEPQDWGDSSDIFIETRLHSTEAEILQSVFKKYEGFAIDEKAILTDYMSRYSSNMYELITPFYFYEPEILEELCTDELFISEIKTYLKVKELGKQLDRVVKTFSKLEPKLRDKLVDEEVIYSLAEKLNGKEYHIKRKLYLFRAMHKLSPSKAYELYKTLDYEILVDDFNSDPRGMSSFVKFMEVFKNIYYYSNEDEKSHVINTVKSILDGCSEQFIKKFEKLYSFGHFHWFLKRLDPMKLCEYFLMKISPAKIIEWIKHKDVRINELRFVFKHARSMQVRTDGTKEELYSYFRRSLDYENVRRIFINKRSKLYDIAITSKFSYEILGNYLYQYCSEDNFAEKVSTENSLYIINESISLVESNLGLSEEQKGHIICRIIDNTSFGERLLKETAKAAKRLGKKLDIHEEKERFLNYKEKYRGYFA